MVKVTGLLAFMLGAADTTNGPEVAPAGTVTVIVLLLHALTVAGVPFSVTALPFCDVPKPVPEITTWIPAPPVVAETLLIAGATIAAEFTDTLSNVAVARLAVFPLLTPSPMNTFCPMFMVWSVPNFSQFTPSNDE
jgi:hypothetical protein